MTRHIIHTPTGNLKESLSFYTKLGFRVIRSDQPPLVTDGRAVIEINPAPYARAGVKCYKSSWKPEVEELKKETKVTSHERGFLFGDPTGTWFYLMEEEPELPAQTSTGDTGLLGTYAGLSLETTDMTRSAAILRILGFREGDGSEEQGWIAFVSDDGFVISLMKPLSCPHLFFNPSMTYFNGENNLEVIRNIRQADIPITQEITAFNKEGIVDNVIIRDPGGYGFFIFND